MHKLGILFLLFFFGLTHIVSASNSYVDTAVPADYISDTQYLEFINLASQLPDNKCCIKSVFDDTQNSYTSHQDGKLFVVSELAMGWPKSECTHSDHVTKTPDALTSEFLRPPIA